MSTSFGGRLRRIVVAFACAALCAGALAVATPLAASADDAVDGFSRAQSLFHERKFREAITALDTYITAHPRDARAIVLRGDCKADLGDNDAALKDYNAAIGIDPEYQYAYTTRCETRLQLDDLAGALADCNTALRLDATDPLSYEDRGDVYFQRQSYALALQDYDKAIELGRTGAYVFAARCDTERLVGKRSLAKPDCEKALAIDPKSRRGLWARSRLAMVESRYTDSIADLNAYIALNPESSDTAYYYRGLAYNRIHSYQNALDDLRTYLGRQSKDPDGYKERAIARYGVGDKAGALADLDLALSGYRRDGNTAEADRVAAMVKAIGAGQPPQP
ncbi:MAG: tetratricopeptide repeat protein [Candidatus Eremiobacteraeota bacterium]|nr:tetratricopeptide repeat protein [Candidatus Eremiobacteraeota bacterium]